MLLTAKFAMSSFIKSSTEKISLETQEEYVHGWNLIFRIPLSLKILTAVYLNICIHIWICTWVNQILLVYPIFAKDNFPQRAFPSEDKAIPLLAGCCAANVPELNYAI